MHTDALIREHALKRLARSITVRQPKRKHSTPPSGLANGSIDCAIPSSLIMPTAAWPPLPLTSWPAKASRRVSASAPGVGVLGALSPAFGDFGSRGDFLLYRLAPVFPSDN